MQQSPESISDRGNPESATSALRTLHFDNCDVVLLASDFSTEVQEEISTFIDQIGRDGQRDHVGNHLEGIGRHFTLTTAAGKKFFVKERRGDMSDRDYTAETYKNLRSIDVLEPEAMVTKRQLNATHSFLSEIRIAQKVTEVLKSPLVQGISKQFGFTSIELIPPLFAAVDRTGKEPRKYTAYEYNAGDVTIANLLVSREPNSIDRDYYDSIVHGINGAAAAIKAIMLENGIRPFDYGPSQFLFDPKTKVLKIIDIEAWHKL